MEINPYYSSFEFWGGMFLFLAALILRVSAEKGSAGRRAVWLELAVGVLLTGDSFAYAFRGAAGDGAKAVVWVSNFISILAACWIAGLFFPYLNAYLSLKKRKKYREWMNPAILLICGIDTVLLILTPFTGFLFSVDSENLYHRGPLMGLAMVLQLMLLAAYLFLSVRERKTFFAVIMGAGLAAGLLQSLIYGFPFLNIYFAVTGVAFFTWELLQETKKTEVKAALIMENEETINEMQTRIALSQIKPHFLYNALNSIYVLCGRNVSEARMAITHLSDYLRSNMSSMDSKMPVPVSREIEMVEDYLAIEKIRFPEELNYTIVTPVTAFSLPALTIQPLVENAVRHGIMPLDSGGIITITTRETEQAFIVSIVDNGVGFDVSSLDSAENDRQHIGIRNVRGRVKRLCGGDVTIRSTLGHGTEAIITIPKQGGNTA